jgi:hypothetical protein
VDRAEAPGWAIWWKECRRREVEYGKGLACGGLPGEVFAPRDGTLDAIVRVLSARHAQRQAYPKVGSGVDRGGDALAGDGLAVGVQRRNSQLVDGGAIDGGITSMPAWRNMATIEVPLGSGLLKAFGGDT